VTIRDKATLLKASLRPEVPTKGIEIKPFQTYFLKDMAHQGGDGICAISLVPIIAIADHDPDFRLPLPFIDVIIHAVADVLAVEGINGQAASPAARVS